MNISSIHNLKNFVEEIGRKMADADKFFTGRLATRLTKAAQAYPQDTTIIQMASFLSQRSGARNGHLISRAELKDVYNRLWTTNTKAGEFLEAELGINPNKLPEPTKMTRDVHEGEVNNIHEKYADQKLVAELEAAFDKNRPYRPGFDPKVAKLAEKYVQSVLPGNPVVQTIDGRDFATLCQASYETPKGKAIVLVPVEVVAGRPLVPTVFFSQAGFQDLTKEAVEAHVVQTAGKYFRVNSAQLFEVVKRVKFGATEEMDSVDRAVMALRAKTGTPANYDPNGILYQQIDPIQEEIRHPESKDTAKFAAELNTTAGSAEFIFGKAAVETGKGIIKSKLADVGYQQAQIKVSNFNDDSIMYSVAINGAGFKIPVKVQKNASGKYMVKVPNMVMAGGSVETFTRQGIQNALGLNDQQSFASAVGMDLSSSRELVNEVEAACEVGDYSRAGSIVTVLASRGDESAFHYAFELYTQALNGGTVKKSTAPKMKTIKIGGNIVEATTGLPADKVYIDENGEVQLKYRRNVEKTDEGAAGGFMNAKIIMGL